MTRLASLSLLGFLVALAHGKDAFAQDVHFNTEIRPILAEFCLECHGPDANRREGDLRLDVESVAKVRAIISNRPDDSELIRRVQTTDADQVMPPPAKGKMLSGVQVEKLRRWIQQGAKYQSHWAFEPVVKPPVPGDVSKVPSEIDRFLNDRLQASGLSMSRPIPREQWIRRATLDLHGLPPSWSEVEAFVSDTSKEAYEKVIDRLLDSPRYGERWGRHWLDIARYADTLGGSAIGFTQFPFSYTYRDYVIGAIARDLPYDRFLMEQLAADQLGLDPNDPAMAGLGYLTVGMQFRNRHDVIDDQIDVVTRGLQGLTVSCARCHDHKFDPITAEDYYSLYAALASSRAPAEMPVVGKPAKEEALHEYQKSLEKSEVIYEDMARDQAEVMRGRLRMQVGLYLREIAKGTPEQDTSTAFLSYRTDDLRPLVINRWRDYMNKMPHDDPIFGPWFRFAGLGAEGFGGRVEEVLLGLEKENGELPKRADLQKLGAAPPRWNPILLEELRGSKPTSMLDVADVYGNVFAKSHQAWLKSLQQSSEEAAAGGTVVPDEDPKHIDINSPLQRQLRRHLYGPGTPTAMSDQVASSLLNRTISDNLAGKRGAIQNLHLTSPGSPPRAMSLEEDPTMVDFTIFRRGNPLDRGKVVTARYLSVLPTLAADPFQVGKRRLGLARAIVAKENPLTRRVLVNWVWQHHFGQGLIRTPDDLGTRGQSPTHPELLDFLAETFMEEGWSLKKLHRRIMLTEAYGQAAVENAQSRSIDPDNELLWRMPRKRLDLEAMRDALLSVSGELDLTMGGRPIELLAAPVVPRRSVYGFINRDIVSNFSSTFDGANPNACTAQRPDTTVPQQTLFALNSEFIQDRAKQLANLAMKEGATSEDRIRWLYQRVYSRQPDPEEVRMAKDFLQASKPADSSDGTEGTGWQRFAHILLAANEFIFLD